MLDSLSNLRLFAWIPALGVFSDRIYIYIWPSTFRNWFNVNYMECFYCHLFHIDWETSSYKVWLHHARWLLVPKQFSRGVVVNLATDRIPTRHFRIQSCAISTDHGAYEEKYTATVGINSYISRNSGLVEWSPIKWKFWGVFFLRF